MVNGNNVIRKTLTITRHIHHNVNTAKKMFISSFVRFFHDDLYEIFNLFCFADDFLFVHFFFFFRECKNHFEYLRLKL